MKRAMFCLLATVVLASSSGCCCVDRLFCWGCNGCGYGHEGPCYGGGGGCSSCGGGGCSDCGSYAGSPNSLGGDGGEMAQAPPRAAMAKRHPAGGHPAVRQRRNSGGEYEFAAGPPSGGTTYPYYTNRAPRDFLARNPRSIGP